MPSLVKIRVAKCNLEERPQYRSHGYKEKKG